MCDWTEYDITRISEEDFPIRCARCGYVLSGLGDSGRCPQCATLFHRRKRLWEIYGPEAFANPPISDVQQPDAGFVYPLLMGVILMLLLPAVLLAWYNVFGEFDLGFGLFAWAVLMAAVIWIVLARWRARAKHKQADDHGRNG